MSAVASVCINWLGLTGLIDRFQPKGHLLVGNAIAGLPLVDVQVSLEMHNSRFCQPRQSVRQLAMRHNYYILVPHFNVYAADVPHGERVKLSLALLFHESDKNDFGSRRDVRRYWVPVIHLRPLHFVHSLFG